MQLQRTAVFSTYTSALDPGQIGRREGSPSSIRYRCIGRDADEVVSTATGIEVHWAQSEHGRERGTITRGGSRRRYAVQCFRGGDRTAHCESAEEAFAATLLDACAGMSFQEQPAKIQFIWNGQSTIHYPDLIVVSDEKTEFWECKRDHEVLSIFVRRRCERLQELLAQLGLGYRLVSTTQLQVGSYLENAIRMRRRAKMVVSPVTTLLLKQHSWLTNLSKAGNVLGDISISGSLDELYTLLYSGQLSGNLSRPISLGMDIGPTRARGKPPWVWDLFGKAS